MIIQRMTFINIYAKFLGWPNPYPCSLFGVTLTMYLSKRQGPGKHLGLLAITRDTGIWRCPIFAGDTA